MNQTNKTSHTALQSYREQMLLKSPSQNKNIADCAGDTRSRQTHLDIYSSNIEMVETKKKKTVTASSKKLNYNSSLTTRKNLKNENLKDQSN